MSKLVAFAAIQGGYNVVSQVEGEYKRALDTWGFPTPPIFCR
jgi:acetyl-CoA synthase